MTRTCRREFPASCGTPRGDESPGFELTYARDGSVWRFAADDEEGLAELENAVIEAAADPGIGFDWFEAWMILRAIGLLAEGPGGFAEKRS